MQISEQTLKDAVKRYEDDHVWPVKYLMAELDIYGRARPPITPKFVGPILFSLAGFPGDANQASAEELLPYLASVEEHFGKWLESYKGDDHKDAAITVCGYEGNLRARPIGKRKEIVAARDKVVMKTVERRFKTSMATLGLYIYGEFQEVVHAAAQAYQVDRR